MKRRNVLATIVALFCFVHCRAQCAQDTLVLGGSPTFATNTDTLDLPPLPCYGYDCKAEYCHVWQLPPNFSGHLEVQANTPFPTLLNIQVWEGCNLVRWDVCAYSSISSRWDTILVFPPNAQVVVCDYNVSVTVTVKPLTTTDTLPPPFLLTDTLCGVLIGTIDPAAVDEFEYWEASTVYGNLQNIVVVVPIDRKPHTAYLKRRRGTFDFWQNR